MSDYSDKLEARKERLKARIEKLREFSKGKDFSLFREENSRIPLGQPILVGHHSERRHRRHLERLENLMRKGFEASTLADRLEEKLERMENSNIIQVNNPDALGLIKYKITDLEKSVEYAKKINKLLKGKGTIFEAIEHFKKLDDDDSKYIATYLEARTHWYASKDIRMFYLSTTNKTAEIRRLKTRLIEVERAQSMDWNEVINGVLIKTVDGYIQVHFKDKPSDEIRDKLKRSPICLKWSRFTSCWTRKVTGQVLTRYFKESLREVLNNV